MKIYPVVIFAILISFFFSLSYLWANDDADRTYPWGQGPDRLQTGVTGSEPSNKDQFKYNTGVYKPDWGYKGPDGSDQTVTGIEYKIPTFIGIVRDLSSDYITVSTKMDNIPQDHTIVINPLTRIYGDISKGATVKIVYQVGRTKKVNRIMTSMTAVRIDLLNPASSETEEEEREEETYEKTSAEHYLD